MSDREVYELLIIGAGPAGLAAACAAQEAGLSYVVVERNGIVQSLVEHPQQIRYFSPSDEIAIGGVPFPVPGGRKPTREDALAYFRGVARSRRLNLALWEEVISAEPMNISDLIDKDDAEARWNLADVDPAAIFGSEAGAEETVIDAEVDSLPHEDAAPMLESVVEEFAPQPDVEVDQFASAEMGEIVVHRPIPGFRVLSQKWNTGLQVERFCRYLLVCTGTFQNARKLDISGVVLSLVLVLFVVSSLFFG